MSNESASSAALPHSLPRQDSQDGPPTTAQLAERQKKNRASFNRKRVELLDDLIRNLDILVYAELSTIYYLDCQTFRLMMRVMIQFMFLTPKPPGFNRLPKPEPYVGAIVGTNLLCLFLHLMSAAPAAGEGTRFYLHGGLALDFIGQRGPTSKLLLLVMDLLVVTLQLVHLSAHIARLKLKDGATPPVPLSRSVQDVDSEERGVRRSAEMRQQEFQGAIELQALNDGERVAAPTSPRPSEDDERRETALRSTAPRSDAFLFDAFWNGQIVLADLNPVETVKDQVIHYNKTPLEVRRNALNEQFAAWGSGLRFVTRQT